MASRRYRVIKRLPWIEGGKPAPGAQWEGGRTVVYEPGDTVKVDDRELAGIYRRLEAIDDAGRAALEVVRAKADAPAQITSVADLSTVERSHIAWGLASSEIAYGEDPKAVFLRALRNGAVLPDDYESRNLILDAIEGKHTPKRSKGRPPKKQPRPDLQLTSVEHAIYDGYRDWLAAFERDPELAWLRFEALRLREQHPDACVWRCTHDLGIEEDRRSYETELKALGAQPCPPKLPGEQTPRELALIATAQQFRPGWSGATGKFLTKSIVARIVTSERERRAKKSE